ncbi:sugar phosphate isomerase/epimerase family protein [Halomarina oriensis]|uniref:TIM barrel protein n=1 Tax=Halomarina oriensis TaxID=671145 RepID=A0A6B0GNX0_9EURY|nr:sugar phosphate isomerase/epimerase [Halomarina oriensis]MWG33835.1 TIM barrel protein [Halomarina oriensis]
MRISLSTLGCPDWDLDTICTTAADNGFDGVDFRGYREEIDVTQHPQFTDRLVETMARLADAGLTVSGLSTSIRICFADKREENLAEARRYIPLAHELGVDTIRVFGVGDAEEHSLEELARVGGETVRDILALDGAADLRWLVETHDNWTSSADCRLLLDELPDDNTGILWDVGHTTRLGGESPAETLDAIGDRIEYVHVKDAVYAPDDENAKDDGWVFVLPGEGELPIDDALRELDDRGYDGWVVHEHEKRWQPYVADPEVAYPAFAEWYRTVLE